MRCKIKDTLLSLITHKYYRILIVVLTNMAGLAFLWTSINTWTMPQEYLLGFKTQTLTWILGTISNLVLALVLYATEANKIPILTVVVWFTAMLNMTIVVLIR